MSAPTARPATPRPTDPLRLQMFVLALVVGVAGALFLLWPEPSPTIDVPVPRADLPTYHVIRHTDLVTSTVKEDELPETGIRTPAGLVGHYTLTELRATKPITSAQVQLLPDPTLITNTVAAGISATSAMVLGSHLKAGDIVDLAVVPTEPITASMSVPSIFQNLLVLDVMPSPQSAAVGNTASPIAFVIIVALPLDRRDEFAVRSVHSIVLVTRRIFP
jgi:hypothetical protein